MFYQRNTIQENKQLKWRTSDYKPTKLWNWNLLSVLRKQLLGKDKEKEKEKDDEEEDEKEEGDHKKRRKTTEQSVKILICISQFSDSSSILTAIIRNAVCLNSNNDYNLNSLCGVESRKT